MINNLNQMYQNNYQMGMQQYGGFQNNRLAANMKNVLSAKELQELMHSTSAIKVDPDAIVRDKCTHKLDNAFAIIPDPIMGEGYFKCRVCGRSFKIVDGNMTEVTELVKGFTNIIDTIQTLGVELPDNFLAELGKMKSVADILPRVHDAVMKTWNNNYATNNGGFRNAGSNSANIYNYMTTNGQVPMGGMGAMQQNLYNNGIAFNNQYNPYGGQQQMGMQYPNQNMNMSMGMQTPPAYGQQMGGMQYPNQGMMGGMNPVTNQNSFFSNGQQQGAMQYPNPNQNVAMTNNTMQQQLMQQQPPQPTANANTQPVAQPNVPNYQGPTAGNGISLDSKKGGEEKAAIATKPTQV